MPNPNQDERDLKKPIATVQNGLNLRRIPPHSPHRQTTHPPNAEPTHQGDGRQEWWQRQRQTGTIDRLNQPAIMQHYAVLDKIVGVFEAWVPLADRTVLLKVPGLDKALAPLGESLGFDIGMLKVCVVLGGFG